MLSDAKEDNMNFDTKELKSGYDKLNATVFIRTTKTFPLVRFFFATLLLIPITIFIIDAIASLLGNDFDTWLTYEQLKGLLSLIIIFLLQGIKRRICKSRFWHEEERTMGEVPNCDWAVVLHIQSKRCGKKRSRNGYKGWTVYIVIIIMFSFDFLPLSREKWEMLHL